MGRPGSASGGRPPVLYEVRIGGQLSPAQRAGLEAINVIAGSHESVVMVRVRDQAELQTWLDRMLGLGVELLHVHRIPPIAEPMIPPAEGQP
jgi:hypothetical protein